MNQTQINLLFGVLNTIVAQLKLIIKILMFSKIGAFSKGVNPNGLMEMYQAVDKSADISLNETESYRRIK